MQEFNDSCNMKLDRMILPKVRYGCHDVRFYIIVLPNPLTREENDFPMDDKYPKYVPLLTYLVYLQTF